MSRFILTGETVGKVSFRVLEFGVGVGVGVWRMEGKMNMVYNAP